MTSTPAAPAAPQPTPTSELPLGADIRLIVTDMDGTLLAPDKSTPDELWPLLDELAQRGIVFAPSSGRQCWTLLDMFDRVREGLTVIAENGAIVMRDGQEISSTPLDVPTVKAVIPLIRAQQEAGVDCGLVMCGKNSAYVERGDQPFLDQVAPYYHRTRVVENLNSAICAIDSGEIDDAIIKLALFCFSDIIPPAMATLATFSGTHQFLVSGHNWADLQTQGVDKGVAVAALQKYLGVTPAQTLAFGDFHNDLGMLAAAEHSFAVTNAHPDVLAAARYIAPSNADGGVLTTIRAILDM